MVYYGAVIAARQYFLIYSIMGRKRKTMKKRLFVVLATVAALSLAMPMSGFAKSNPADVTSSSTQSKAFKVEKAKTIQGFGDVSAQELIHSEDSFVEKDGENDYYESYSTSM